MQNNKEMPVKSNMSPDGRKLRKKVRDVCFSDGVFKGICPWCYGILEHKSGARYCYLCGELVLWGKPEDSPLREDEADAD